MKLVLLAFLLECAVTIWAGTECEPQSRPWVVHFSSGCSGALINEQWVLTVMDCYVTPQVTVAYLGKNNLNVEENSEQRIFVDVGIVHDPYMRKRRRRSPLHNIQMVRLATPAKLNSYVQPVSLSTRCPLPEDDCVVSGWETRQQSSMQCVVQPIPDKRACQFEMFGPPDEFCTEYVHNITGSHLAEGSPMTCGGYLQGLVSWGQWCLETYEVEKSYSCVCHYHDWIDKVMRSHVSTTTAAPRTDTTRFVAV
ncbi:trypsinogen-like protein 3 [Chanos chanos]|uniref:Trypsinogen-like protein 3 n=1 Tax=Chanos chanos TaxID=29144 RepID=A0A6J2WCX9_CHACN|nr:trypsinogen-like protein 3 [Chanos chanos]